MYNAPGSKTPITRPAIKLILTLFVVGVVSLLLLFVLFKRFPGLLRRVFPQDGYQCYFYRDADGDGRGNPEEKILGKLGEVPPSGYTLTVGDCDDNNPNR